MADNILASIGKSTSDYRDDNRFHRLLEMLSGHPRSLELMLPLLTDHTPEDLVRVLQTSHSTKLVADSSLSYSFGALCDTARRKLLLLGLFADYVVLRRITYFVAPGSSTNTLYERVLGPAPTEDDWRELLERASHQGFVRRAGVGVYELHPTMGPFLRQQFASAFSQSVVTQFDEEYGNFYASLAAFLLSELDHGNMSAIREADVEEGNFLRAIRILILKEQWGAVHEIVLMLRRLYEARTQFARWESLLEELLEDVGPQDAKWSTEKFQLWAFVAGAIATLCRDRSDLDTAASWFSDIRSVAELRDDHDGRMIVADTALHQAIVQQFMGDFEAASQYLKEAEEAARAIGADRNVAHILRHQGDIALERKDHAVARRLYKDAIESLQDLNAAEELPTVLMQLSTLEFREGHLDQSYATATRALALSKEHRHFGSYVGCLHQLGMIAQKYAEVGVDKELWLTRAEEAFRESLGHAETHKLPARVAAYCHLAAIKNLRHEFPDSVRWLFHCMNAGAELGMPPSPYTTVQLAIAYRALGEARFLDVWNEVGRGVAAPLDVIRECADIMTQGEVNGEIPKQP